VGTESAARVILIDADDERRETLARRLRAQGYEVDLAATPTAGAGMALCNPPAAVVADLWMPQVSGFQLCRLLKSEAATADVPVILRSARDERSNRFWAERAGAAAYVGAGGTAELVRALGRAIAAASPGDGFFTQLDTETVDIRDRIAQHLDDALYESVIAGEVRALSVAATFDRLFDLLIQFLSQVVEYRSFALHAFAPSHIGVHAHPRSVERWQRGIRELLQAPPSTPVLEVADEDADPSLEGPEAMVQDVYFGSQHVGRFAVASTYRGADALSRILSVLTRELGAPLRMVAMVEEVNRLASEDELTRLLNRRAFFTLMTRELARCRRYSYPLGVVMVDVDHFKAVNDRYGHASGDAVLAHVSAMLRQTVRTTDLAARWGGEEFVVALTSTPLQGALVVAERLRQVLSSTPVRTSGGQELTVTASLGVSSLQPGDTVESVVDRADRAMYRAKHQGRNRVVAAPQTEEEETEHAGPERAQA
jgi:two-component system, cell cycle response regulator